MSDCSMEVGLCVLVAESFPWELGERLPLSFVRPADIIAISPLM